MFQAEHLQTFDGFQYLTATYVTVFSKCYFLFFTCYDLSTGTMKAFFYGKRTKINVSNFLSVRRFRKEINVDTLDKFFQISVKRVNNC